MIAERITDFSVWDLREEFNDYEVSYLWLGLEPSYANDHPSNVIAFRHALGEAKSRGELDCRDNSGRHIYQDKWGRERGIFVQDIPRYQRQSLRKWAILKEQRPLFLFPEDRPLSICSPALLSADQQRLPIVLAMLKELGFDPLDIPRSGKSRALNKLMERYPGKFTPDKFEETWKAGKRDGLFKMSS